MPRKTTEQFIKEASEIHNNQYDYSKTEYIKAHAKIIIICPIHGEFEQKAYAHLQGQGCPKCGYKKRKIPHKKTTKQFIKEAQLKWGNKYNYSNTKYVGKNYKLKYICPIHGEIEQYPKLHLKNGCPYCNGRGISKHNKTSFINIANKIHQNKYDYSKIQFIRMSDNIVITCPIHGDFEQRAGNHIHLENGCPKCAGRISKQEKSLLKFIKLNYSDNIIENDRQILNGKEIDIYLPNLKIGIEYHGLYWHLETVVGKKLHYEKWSLCNSKNIRLIQIYSNEWIEKRKIVESKICNLFKMSKRIYARKTKLIKLGKEKNKFLDKNHLQGSDSSKIAYGLIYENELVSCMTFGPSRFNKKYDYELLRFCNKTGYSVIGGASKLLKRFKKDYKGSIISYADKRHSNGNLYYALGFSLDNETDPSFSYVRISDGMLFNRMKFQKKNLIKSPNYSSDLTEYEIMQLDGYDRIWDAGQYRFIMN